METKDAAEATARFGEFITKGSRKRAINTAGVTVAQGLDWYVQDHVEPHVVDKTRQLNAIVHLKAFFGDMLFRNVNVALTRAYADARRRGAIGGGKRRRSKVGSDSTIRRELHVLVAAANSAIYLEKMPVGESPRVELPEEVRGDKVPWLTKEQLATVFGAAKGKLLAFVKIAYYTAARRRAIEKLRKVQIDLQHGNNVLHGFGRRTKKRRPIVPLYAEIRPVVERLLNESDTEFLFGRPRDFYREFVELTASLGFEAHPHMLRHSRATHMLMDGEDPYKVAKLLGDTLATVERVYGHYKPGYLQTTSTIAEGGA